LNKRSGREKARGREGYRSSGIIKRLSPLGCRKMHSMPVRGKLNIHEKSRSFHQFGFMIIWQTILFNKCTKIFKMQKINFIQDFRCLTAKSDFVKGVKVPGNGQCALQIIINNLLTDSDTVI